MPAYATALCAYAGCDRLFPALLSKLKRGGGRYCSPACQHQGRMNSDGPALLAASHRVNEHGCHLWTKAMDSHGYGIGRWRGRQVKAARLAFYLANGRWPQPQVRHLCEGFYAVGDRACRLCVNPLHLGEGDDGDQYEDKRRAGRLPVGERVHTARLTAEVVAAARVRYRDGGVTYKQLAREVGVDPSSVRRAVTGKTWGHIGMCPGSCV